MMPALVYIHDVYPTVCELVGAEMPKDIDGISFAPVIKGKLAKTRDHLMFAYCETQRAIRDEEWKLIRYPQINRTQLFNLKKDPWEMRDLSREDEHQDRIQSMTALLASEQKNLGDDLPLTSDNPKPAEFRHPNRKLKTPYPAGGLAPGWKPASQQDRVESKKVD